MTKIDLGQSLGIIANLGVVAGIVLLAVELHQNNLLLQSQARMNRLELRKAGNYELIENPHLQSAVLKWNQGNPLSTEEQDLVRRYWSNRFHNVNAIYEEYQSGLIPEYQIQTVGFLQQIHGRLSEYWNVEKIQLNPDFVRWVEERADDR